MNKKKKLIKNTIIILLGKTCTQFLSFLLLPLYTASLQSNELGTSDIITTYVSLFVPVITLQLEMAVFREMIDIRKNENQKKELISSATYGILFNLIICILAYNIIGHFINIPFKNYILSVIICTIISNYFLQIARGNGDNIGYSIASVIAGISTLLSNIIFILVLDFKIEGILLSTAIGNFLAACFLFLRCKIYKFINSNNISKQQLKKLLKYSIPLVPNGLIWWIINASDRTLITIFLGVSSNGIYAVANKFSNILIQVFNVFNLSWAESASIHIQDNDKNNYFSDTFNMTIKLFMSICILLTTSLFFIFPIMVNKEFNDAYIYIPLLLLGMIFNIIVSFMGSIYVALKKTKEVAKTSLYASILNIVTNILLIKKIGLYAAAISTIIAFLAMAIYRYIDVQKYVKLKLDYKMLVKLFILLIITSIICFIRENIISIISLIFVTFYLLHINKEILLQTKNIIKKLVQKKDIIKNKS